jgi:hypothetical protein
MVGMADGVFRVGLQVLHTRYPEFLPDRARGRRTRIAGIVAAATGTVLFISVFAVGWGEPTPLALTASAIFAVAMGCFSAMFTSTRTVKPDWSFTPTGDWRRAERVDRQFATNPPAMDPADRDLVLAKVERLVGPLVMVAARTLWMPIGWGVATIGLIVMSLGGGVTFEVAVPLLVGFLQSANFIAATSGLGRTELARRRAEAMPELPPEQPKTWPQGTGPNGSKMRLPGD